MKRGQMLIQRPQPVNGIPRDKALRVCLLARGSPAKRYSERPAKRLWNRL